MITQRPEVAEKLDHELVGWFTTVTQDGQPQSSPVWFVREDDDLLVYSKPDAPRIHNIADNSRIAFNLRGDRQGDIVVTMEGRATTAARSTQAADHHAYLAKYGTEIVRLGFTPDTFSADYSVPVVITIERIRAWG